MLHPLNVQHMQYATTSKPIVDKCNMLQPLNTCAMGRCNVLQPLQRYIVYKRNMIQTFKPCHKPNRWKRHYC